MLSSHGRTRQSRCFRLAARPPWAAARARLHRARKTHWKATADAAMLMRKWENSHFFRPVHPFAVLAPSCCSGRAAAFTQFVPSLPVKRIPHCSVPFLSVQVGIFARNLLISGSDAGGNQRFSMAAREMAVVSFLGERRRSPWMTSLPRRPGTTTVFPRSMAS